jgi:hypothetical protein
MNSPGVRSYAKRHKACAPTGSMLRTRVGSLMVETGTFRECGRAGGLGAGAPELLSCGRNGARVVCGEMGRVGEVAVHLAGLPLEWCVLFLE